MVRYDVFASPAGPAKSWVFQSDVLSGLNTRIVVPLLPPGVATLPAKPLKPVFSVSGALHVMVTHFMVAVPSALLRQFLTLPIAHDTQTANALGLLLSGIVFPTSSRWSGLTIPIASGLMKSSAMTLSI